MNTWCERTKQAGVSHHTVSHEMLLQTEELHQLQMIVQRQIWDRERAALEGEVKKLREQACCWAEQVKMGSSFSPSDLYIYRSDQKRCSLSLSCCPWFSCLGALGWTFFLTNCCTSFFRVRKLPDAFFGIVFLRSLSAQNKVRLSMNCIVLRMLSSILRTQVACLEEEVSHLRSSLSRNMSSEANNCELEKRSSVAGVWRSSDSRARTAKTGHEERETEGSMSISPISRSSSSTDNDVCHPATSPVGPINPVAGLRQRLSSAEQVYKRLQRAGLRQRWYVMCGRGAGGDRMRLCGYVCYVCARKHTLC